MSGRDVDDQITDSTGAYGLQMLAYRMQMHPLDERGLWFEHVPSLAYEFMQASPRHLLLQMEAVERGPVPG
jgi:hypothetical protein